MKKIVWCGAAILVLFFSTPLSAQRAKTIYQGSYPEYNLRTSLTSYFDFDAGIMLGIGYRWSNNFSASFEPTWIFYNALAVDRFDKIYPSGIKIRTDLKYHFPRRTKKSLDAFIAPEFHYKYTKTRKEDQFGINCQNGQCAYFQDAVYTDLKNEIGGSIKAGMILPLTFINKKERLFLEFYGGFGIKQLKFRETDLPVGGSFVSPPDRSFLGFNIDDSRNIYSRPMLPGGLKLIFTL